MEYYSPRATTIIEQSQVSPPPGTVDMDTVIPLTFFDLLWSRCCPMQRLYFYEHPHSLQHMSQTLVPSLKQSLSLTLRHFFPFAAVVVYPPPPEKPHIRFSDGDFVTFTVAESAGDFDALFAPRQRDAEEIHLFVPDMPPVRKLDSGARAVPLMALQVTLFPNSGFTLGVAFHHVAADGKGFHHFMKSWASLCKAGGDPTAIETPTPFHRRDSMAHLEGLGLDLLDEAWQWASSLKEVAGPKESWVTNPNISGMVRTSFAMSQGQIQRLKDWVIQRLNDQSSSVHVSTFVCACALLWVSLLKSDTNHNVGDNIIDVDEPCYFIFAGDCRDRLDFVVPSNYFGNCLAFCIVGANKCELMGEEGIVGAARALGTKVRGIESGVLVGAENWMRDWMDISGKYHSVTVAGSTKLGIYDTDFGHGRPKKTEVVHTDVSGAVSLSESRDDKHGIEVGLARPKEKMDRFSVILEENLKLMGIVT